MEFVVRVPAWTPSDATVFVSGDRRELGSWRPDAVRLRKQRDGTWRASVRVEEGVPVQWKVTLGRWDCSERDSTGADVGNRLATGGERALAEVHGWGKQYCRASTVVGELHTHERFYSHALGNVRTVWVWLPPGYASSTGSYPVVYMHDGQNLFDAARASFGVEWGVDEAMTAGIASGAIRPAIIVGVENTSDRFGEYTPTVCGGIGGRGGGYARLLLDEVRPFIDANYRTSTAPEDTFTAGSSLGGLISLYLLSEHADVFGGAAGVSPSLWWDGECFLKGTERDPRWAAGKRIWIDMGTEEHGWGAEGDHIARTLRMRDALERTSADVRCEIVEGAEHNEASWSRRIGDILAHLLGGAR